MTSTRLMIFVFWLFLLFAGQVLRPQRKKNGELSYFLSSLCRLFGETISGFDVDALLSFSDVNEETVTLLFNFEFNAMLSSNE